MATMNPVAVAFEHILVPTDFSEISQRALEYAKVIARQANSELVLVHVNTPVALIDPCEAAWIDESGIQSQREEQLEQSGAALRSGGYRARAISVTGPLYDELLSLAQLYKADLIVLGTHGKKGLERLLLGSDAEAVLRQAGCPVLSVGPGVPVLRGKPWRIREIICATTLDPRSAGVAAYAHKLAVLHGAELVLFHVKSEGDYEDVNWALFEEALHQRVPEGLGTSSWLRSRLLSTPPGTSIADFAKQRGSDLIVMGAHPASSMATHLVCGAAAKALVEAPCPVMTLLQQ
jgi:nucleotide-binding universal stress UspA family protein